MLIFAWRNQRKQTVSTRGLTPSFPEMRHLPNAVEEAGSELEILFFDEPLKSRCLRSHPALTAVTRAWVDFLVPSWLQKQLSREQNFVSFEAPILESSKGSMHAMIEET